MSSWPFPGFSKAGSAAGYPWRGVPLTRFQSFTRRVSSRFIPRAPRPREDR